ncbi:hypothetical protein BJAS_P4209 [Bathymodiolus japonicus methanotrophic gill symbiont]|uniref:VapE domain-containing protein n=1 Tax=Bathymodiolus japonicus methanotrophic gill symbiont TaxID=113269 RepID=UPI001B6F1236|nr:VapE domain-containing protein [Bathymodiolus japonicus methanotrophic gill symbiont]GFO73417.1 hypothetical protein BJAS_P4209 [Bathymodiolus japonicus methanotrophic gill symbiont]
MEISIKNKAQNINQSSLAIPAIAETPPAAPLSVNILDKAVLYQKRANEAYRGETTTPRQFVERLKTNDEHVVAYQRKLKTEGKSEAVKALKIKMSAISFSGGVNDSCGRRAKDFDKDSCTGIFHVDIDALQDSAGVERVIGIVKATQGCLFAFRSVSGLGVKAGFNVGQFDNDEQFKEIFYKFEYLFKVEHGITIDPACKDILRLCFTSYDPDYFINDDAVEIDVNAMDLPAINNVFESPDNDLPVQNIPSLVAVPDAHPWTAERIKEVIKHIPSEDYDQWIMVGMAIYHSGANGGFSVWDEWSKTSKKYNKTEISKKWCSFDNGDNPKNVSMGTVVKLSREHTKQIKWNHTTMKGKPIPTPENLEALIEYYGVSVSYDELLLETNIKGIQSMKGNEHNSLIAFLKGKCAIHGISDRVVDMQLDAIIESNIINPVTDCLKVITRTKSNNPVDELVELLPVDNKTWVKIAMYRWLIQCCAAADMARNTPNDDAIDKYESVLVFFGEQGHKKTSFIRYILPKLLHKYTKEGILLDVKDKDSMLHVLKCWIPELGELDSTFKRSDISALKAFLSMTEDEIRLPYARKPLKITRHISCIGTVNEKEYLRDATGNRRFLPITTTGSLDIIVKENFDYTDLWGYVWGQYMQGEQWWLTEEEEVLQKEVLSKHEDTNLKELLLDVYNFDTSHTKKMTSTEVLRDLSQKTTRQNQIKLGIVLKDLSVEKSTPRSRDYMMPLLRDVYPNRFPDS